MSIRIGTIPVSVVRRAARIVVTGIQILLLMLCCGIASLARADVTIVDNGSANATIVVAADADPVVVDAVADLQAYIQKMSGAVLPIVNTTPTSGNMIFVGRLPAVDVFIPDLDSMDLGPDGYVIKVLSPSAIFITGQSDGHDSNFHPRIDCGTPNAVYAFLESLGCRWYMPGDDGEVVPTSSTIVVPDQDIASKPDFDCRWLAEGVAYHMGGQIYADFRDWLARIRSSPNAYHQGEQMSSLVPRSLFATHPEYFALVDGERRGDAAARVCYAQPGAISTATNTLRGFLGQLDWRSFPVGQYDAWLWCQDALCYTQYGSQTFTYLTQAEARAVGRAPSSEVLPNVANAFLNFTNQIAAAVEAQYPDTLITHCYGVYNTPGFPEFPPRSNVMPVLCHLVPNDAAWAQQVEAWASMSPKLYFYGYLGYRTGYPKLQLIDDIRWCHQRNGIAMILTVAEHSPFIIVPFYLASRGLWDTSADGEAVMTEFYTRYYGAGAAAMQLFYEIHHAGTLDAVLDWDSHSSYPDTVTQTDVSLCRDLLDTAAVQATEPVVQRRIAWMARYWTAVEKDVAARDAMNTWREARTAANETAARNAINDVKAYISSVTAEFYLLKRHGYYDRWLLELSKSAVAGRYVFYNNSSFDGNYVGPNAADDNAIAADKEPRLPFGGICTVTNYTSYDKGINGIMVDLYRPEGTVTVDDFEFRVGNTNDTATWVTAPTPPIVTVRPAPGHEDTDRVTIIWPDTAIRNQWLEVTVKSTFNTWLAEPDVFYFGNAVGECGDSPTAARVNATDEIAARNNPRNAANPADVTDPYDYDRDGRVNATDEIIARNNPTNFMTELKLITP